MTLNAATNTRRMLHRVRGTKGGRIGHRDEWSYGKTRGKGTGRLMSLIGRLLDKMKPIRPRASGDPFNSTAVFSTNNIFIGTKDREM